MLISRLTNLKKVQRCQGASQSSRFNERRTLWKYNENHNADTQVRRRARNVSFIAAGMHPIKVDPRIEDRGLSMWLRRHYYRYRCFSRGDIILFSLAGRFIKFSIIFMVYGSRRATESATTTGIAWLHNITAQGNYLCSILFILYNKYRLHNEFCISIVNLLTYCICMCDARYSDFAHIV